MRQKLKNARHLMLVSEMIGVEGHVTAEFVLMIANLQTLGVPLVYTSLPIVCSASISLIFIPILGYLNTRWAVTLKLKAFILICVNCVQVTGGYLVLMGNLLKLKEIYQDSHNNISSTVPTITDNSTNYLEEYSQMVDIDPNATATVNLTTLAGENSELKLYAISAMVGYVMMDCGYDTSSCFLKTFALACTTAKDHSSIIVKSILLSSLGGCFVTVLGSVGIGEKIASAAGLDTNIMTSVLLISFCLAIMIPTMIMSLLTGLCCFGQDSYDEEEEDSEFMSKDVKDEKTHLIGTPVISSSTSNGGNKMHTTYSENSVNGSHKTDIGPSSQDENGENNNGKMEIANSDQNFIEKSKSFWKKHENRIILCSADFFAVGAVFSFSVYSVNFVATSIFHGDPSAPVNNQMYANYTEGVKAGSTGFLLFYSSFVVATILQNFLLNRIGWWTEMVIIFLSYTVANIACATFKTVWIYYLTSCLSGFCRSVLFTVPYILVDRITMTKSEMPGRSDHTNSMDIALVAAMLPMSMVVYSAVMGPLLEATGNAASPLYFTAASTSMGLVLFSLLRKY